jgi:hypothetical protein
MHTVTILARCLTCSDLVYRQYNDSGMYVQQWKIYSVLDLRCVCCMFLYKQWPQHFHNMNSKSMKKHTQVLKYYKHYFHSILTKNGIVIHIKLHKSVSLNVILLYCYLHSLRYQQIQLIYWLLGTIPNPHMLWIIMKMTETCQSWELWPITNNYVVFHGT